MGKVPVWKSSITIPLALGGLEQVEGTNMMRTDAQHEISSTSSPSFLPGVLLHRSGSTVTQLDKFAEGMQVQIGRYQQRDGKRRRGISKFRDEEEDVFPPFLTRIFMLNTKSTIYIARRKEDKTG